MRVCLHFTSALWVFAGGLFSVAQAGETVVVPYNQSWKFLHPMGTSPAVIGDDPDYDSTWWLDEENFSSLYNGPEFGVPQIGVPTNAASINSGTGSGPLGYGAVDNWNGINTPLLVPFGETFPILSMGSFLTTPRDGNRKASYYRTTFFTSDLMLKPLIRCMIDDGAVIFLDGVQVARVNLDLPSPSSLPLYGTQALGDGVANGVVPAVPQSTENTCSRLISPGPVIRERPAD